MKKQRRKHCAEFKEKVALEAFRRIKTISEIASGASCKSRIFVKDQVSADSEACEKFYRRHITNIPRIKF